MRKKEKNKNKPKIKNRKNHGNERKENAPDEHENNATGKWNWMALCSQFIWLPWTTCCKLVWLLLSLPRSVIKQLSSLMYGGWDRLKRLQKRSSSNSNTEHGSKQLQSTLLTCQEELKEVGNKVQKKPTSLQTMLIRPDKEQVSHQHTLEETKKQMHALQSRLAKAESTQVSTEDSLKKTNAQLSDTQNKLKMKEKELEDLMDKKEKALHEHKSSLDEANEKLLASQEKEKKQTAILSQATEELAANQNLATEREEEIKVITQRKNEDISNLNTEIYRLQERNKETEEEKQDALRSQLVSVKLRDNNPNIVDLSDQFRPTKLAEMFSELYDNEWTGAYTVMEDDYEESQIICFLLDIIMEAYDECKMKLDQTWQYVSEWYLNENFPWNQQTSKALKDGRKINIQMLSAKLEEKFVKLIKGRCNDDKLTTMILEVDMQKYIKLCVKICLLMNATDPPVVIKYPGWTSWHQKLQEQEKATMSIKPSESISENRKDDCDTSNTTSPLSDGGTQTNQFSTYNDQSEDRSETTTAGDQQDRANVAVDTSNGMLSEDSPKPEFKRINFNKDTFKEYTKRGPYLEFVVWPAMYLHEGGAMLGKGVAQGTNVECSDHECADWKWWK